MAKRRTPTSSLESKATAYRVEFSLTRESLKYLRGCELSHHHESISPEAERVLHAVMRGRDSIVIESSVDLPYLANSIRRCMATGDCPDYIRVEFIRIATALEADEHYHTV